MVLKIIKNNKIKSNKKEFDRFLESYHGNPKQFTIDCDYLNIDYFNSETNVTIRHRKPTKESIYYTSVYKEKDEITYLFGLARENVVATSSFMDMGSQIRPILVAVLNLEDSSKSTIVFAEDSDEFKNVILLRIDCGELNDEELLVLKNKNKISQLEEGKGFINFGAIGEFNTLRNIRNFISNVEFEYDNGLYAKIISVSIPINGQFAKPDSDVVKDRFYNYGKVDSSLVVIDSNEEDDSYNESGSYNEDGSYNEGGSFNESSSIGEYDSNNEDSSKKDDLILEKIDLVQDKVNLSLDEIDSIQEKNNLNLEKEEFELYEPELYKNYIVDDNEIYLELSINREEFFKIMQLLNNLVDSYTLDLDYIEVLDMGDELLNICSTILINDETTIEIIGAILKNNDFKNV
ncbi:MAG: hypothetical protein IKV87_05725 [Methanobrevibacter sp.]|nr:hypothetical protein [Methanobrevibacter sp.]